MDEYIKVTAKSVEDAVLEASIQLGTTSDNIEYRVIERETKGFLGIGAKKAMIEARRKVSEEELINEMLREKEEASGKGSSKKTAKKETKSLEKAAKKDAKEQEKAEKKAEKKADKKADKKAEKKAEKKEAEKAGKTEKPDKKDLEKKDLDKKDSDRKDSEHKAAESSFVTADPAKSAESPARVPADPEVVKSRAEGFLSELLQAMGVEAAIRMEYEDGTLNIDLEGDDMGLLIGKRGQTLDSIQYLTSLVVNKGKAAYVRVKIDTENYRERRKATLENLAKNMAFKVKKTRRPAYLEPMNPYERRIIHSALQNDPYVTTHSEGDEPARKVVITLRKREKEDSFEEE